MFPQHELQASSPASSQVLISQWECGLQTQGTMPGFPCVVLGMELGTSVPSG